MTGGILARRSMADRMTVPQLLKRSKKRLRRRDRGAGYTVPHIPMDQFLRDLRGAFNPAHGFLGVGHSARPFKRQGANKYPPGTGRAKSWRHA